MNNTEAVIDSPERCFAVEQSEMQLLLESELEQIASSVLPESPTREAVRYSLFPGGKRVRPLLALMLCRELGGSWKDLVRPAACLEVLHCASLIHDDLPAIDNDEIRRGKPSCHKKFSEATAILTGDLMAALALKALTVSRLPAQRLIRVIEAMSGSYAELCAGQQLDLEDKNSLEQVLQTHKFKTGALFRAAARCAGIVAELAPGDLDICDELGLWIGVSFQLVDDYLDFFGDENNFGRPTGSDVKNSRKTYFSEEAHRSEGLAQIRSSRQKIGELLGRLHTNAWVRDSIEAPFAGTKDLIEAIFSRVDWSNSLNS